MWVWDQLTAHRYLRRADTSLKALVLQQAALARNLNAVGEAVVELRHVVNETRFVSIETLGRVEMLNEKVDSGFNNVMDEMSQLKAAVAQQQQQQMPTLALLGMQPPAAPAPPPPPQISDDDVFHILSISRGVAEKDGTAVTTFLLLAMVHGLGGGFPSWDAWRGRNYGPIHTIEEGDVAVVSLKLLRTAVLLRMRRNFDNIMAIANVNKCLTKTLHVSGWAPRRQHTNAACRPRSTPTTSIPTSITSSPSSTASCLRRSACP